MNAIAAGASHQSKDFVAGGVAMGARGRPVGAFGLRKKIAIVTRFFWIVGAITTQPPGEIKFFVAGGVAGGTGRRTVRTFNFRDGIAIVTNLVAHGGVIAANGPICGDNATCLLYTSPSPRDRQKSRMPSSA